MVYTMTNQEALKSAARALDKAARMFQEYADQATAKIESATGNRSAEDAVLEFDKANAAIDEFRNAAADAHAAADKTEPEAIQDAQRQLDKALDARNEFAKSWVTDPAQQAKLNHEVAAWASTLRLYKRAAQADTTPAPTL